MSRSVAVLAMGFLLNSCSLDSRPGVPGWAREAIWYQIFVERFRNGDPSNDPTLADIEGSWPHDHPETWRVTPWGSDWYAQEDWARATGNGFYTTVQMRRYGGDLQGVIERLDYLQQLGVTALYFNPINDSPSLHKYDARNYRHIDRNFGPDPDGDRQIMSSEDPADPSTWQWTAADRLFLELLRDAHRRGMRVILDYSWNHTGITFWAWRDILRNQAASKFAGWYEIERFDDRATNPNEFKYSGWSGVRELPELKKVADDQPKTAATWKRGPRDGDLHPAVKEHAFAVTRRWLDPDGDGDPSDGVDGFRLDVAELVPLGFWRDYRNFVKGINPQALLVAELWWEKWPDHLLDPAPWLEGDVFDAVMNYRWYAASREFFKARSSDSARTYAKKLSALEVNIPRQSVQAMMNVAATHDSPRVATSLFNPGKYKYRVSARRNPRYRTGRPDAQTRARQKLLLVQQFTWTGAPHIFYGDEVGMYGADDPDCRKPMVWSDLEYRPDSTDQRGKRREATPVEPDLELFGFYERLIAIRKRFADVFSRGQVRFIESESAKNVLVYVRSLGARRIIVVVGLNRSGQKAEVLLPVKSAGPFRDLLALDEDMTFDVQKSHLRVPFAPFQARILVP